MATFIIGEAEIREIVEQDAPELSDEQTTRAVERIMIDVESIDLNALAAHVVEQVGVDLAEFEEDDDD